MDLTEKISRILNVFENDSGSPETDYKAIYIYHDGNNNRRQVTLARGFTDDGGSLKIVVRKYISKGGQLAQFFTSFLTMFGTGVLVGHPEFIDGLKTAADEQVMRDAQDETYREVYLDPAYAWASSRGFVDPLSTAVIADSYLHSGGMLKWLMNKFPEKKPVDGGDEQEWIIAYLKARYGWLHGSSGALRNTTYRPEFFLYQAHAENWTLNCPIQCRGATIC